jgi:hypothetical protein
MSMRLCLVLCLGVALLGGCGRGGAQSEVAGTVTLDGKPIGPGWIEFTSPEKKMSASGTINADGSYSLVGNPKTGLAAGKYQVALEVREAPANANPSDRPPPGKLLIPEKYGLGTTSGLEFEIAAGANKIDVPLKSN